MARNRGIQWEKIIGAIVFYAFCRYYVIPKFTHDMEHNAQIAMQHNMQIIKMPSPSKKRMNKLEQMKL